MSKQKQNFLYATCSELVFFCNSMNDLSSYCELTDSRLRTSDTDLPVPISTGNFEYYHSFLNTL